MVPHLDAAYNLARWLLRDERAAEDAVQEAALRAFRYLDSLRGSESKPWLLGIVRNTCFNAMEKVRLRLEVTGFDEEELEALGGVDAGRDSDPLELLQTSDLRAQIDAAIGALPAPLREVIVLRELEELDYAQIAKVVAVPVGTVMSRLSRARGKLREALGNTGVRR